MSSCCSNSCAPQASPPGERRNGDANMRSVWLCTRNDMIGNLAVMLAAVGVFGSNSGWPDIAVASIMAVLGLSAARDIVKRARSEMRSLSTSLT